MSNLRQNGVTVIKLSDLVREYCLLMGNTKQTAIAKNVMLAANAWKEMLRTTIDNTIVAYLPVDPDTHTITLPENCERVKNISVLDIMGKTQPLTLNPYYNTVKVKCAPNNTCSCTHCAGTNTETLCGAIDAVTRTTKIITIQEVEYTQTTWVRNDCEGNIQKVTDTPYFDTQTGSVILKKEYETICQVTVDSNGCIEATAPNISILGQYFGYGGYYNGYAPAAIRQLIQTSYNYYGEYNYDAADSNIIHIFRNQRNCQSTSVQYYDINTGTWANASNNIDAVIVSYNTNGEQQDVEMLIPEYAKLAVQTKMRYDTELLHPRMNPNVLAAKLYAYNRERMKVAKFLNPLRADDVAKLQTNKRLW